jgi:hypothetical protein
VLRGGSFNNNERNARCAYRNNNNPKNRNDNNGFRVGVSHGLPAGSGHLPPVFRGGYGCHGAVEGQRNRFLAESGP